MYYMRSHASAMRLDVGDDVTRVRVRLDVRGVRLDVARGDAVAPACGSTVQLDVVGDAAAVVRRERARAVACRCSSTATTTTATATAVVQLLSLIHISEPTRPY